MFAFFALLIATAVQAAAANRPNLFIFIADDFGYGNLGYHRKPSPEVVTSNMNEMAASGVKLERFYTYHICSPSRSSLQSGRLPVHVNMENVEPVVHNALDPTSGYAGIPRNMTCIAEKLKLHGGYRTVFTGKWDVGMATPRHTPRGRGYDEFLGYFHHANDYWTAAIPVTSTGAVDVCLNRFTDMWHNDKPAYKLAGSAYEEILFENHTVEQILTHRSKFGESTPLFLVHSFHLVHTPLQVPQAYLNKFAFISYENRKKYAAMVNFMDDSMGRIVQAVKDAGMYENSLLLFFSDNGGPIYNPGSANNHPLRGGKYSDFEGGMRVNAFAFGGIIPHHRRGQVSHEVVHICDVYSSFLRIAMFDLDHRGSFLNESELQKMVFDAEAHEVGLPPVDSQNTLWGAITGDVTNNGETGARLEVHLSPKSMISGQYKVMTGRQAMNMWQGEYYPNATGFQPSFFQTGATLRSLNCLKGCLFNVFDDPTEHEELSAKLPQLRNTLVKRLKELNRSVFQPHRGVESMRACAAARNLYGGFYGPFLDLPSSRKRDVVKLTMIDEELMRAQS